MAITIGYLLALAAGLTAGAAIFTRRAVWVAVIAKAEADGQLQCLPGPLADDVAVHNRTREATTRHGRKEPRRR